eukprot:6152924-Pleurochrysis_carterae.AAC.1
MELIVNSESTTYGESSAARMRCLWAEVTMISRRGCEPTWGLLSVEKVRRLACPERCDADAVGVNVGAEPVAQQRLEARL